MTDDKPTSLLSFIYPVTIRADDRIPTAILTEHLTMALEDFKLTRTEVTVAHPFADPTNVVFDDDVQTEKYTGPNADPEDPYPLVTRVLDFFKGHERHG